MSDRSKFRICLVASGGGHLRQLLQLAPDFADHDYAFLTERTALGESIAKEHPTRFITYFHFGQRRLEGHLAFVRSGVGNAITSIWHFMRFRPHVVISTGSGSTYVTLLLSWMFRRKVIYIESIARVKGISLFGRLVSPLVGLHLVQWPDLVTAVPKARYCDPLRIAEGNIPPKKDQVLVTIGTFVPFDRLISAVVDLKERGVLTGRVMAQIGDSDQTFNGIETFASCSYTDMNRFMDESDLVICHGGSGSMLGALKAGCRVVAMARKPELGEHYDAHQIELTSALEKKGVLSVAQDENDLERAVVEARSRPRQRVEYDPTALVAEIKAFIS